MKTVVVKAAAAFLTLPLPWALAPGEAQATVPHEITYRGYLTNAAGTPVNATVSITFKLWDRLTNGAAVHSEVQSVTVTNGVFNVVHGARAHCGF